MRTLLHFVKLSFLCSSYEIPHQFFEIPHQNSTENYDDYEGKEEEPQGMASEPSPLSGSKIKSHVPTVNRENDVP